MEFLTVDTVERIKVRYCAKFRPVFPYTFQHCGSAAILSITATSISGTTRNVGQCPTWWSPCRTGGALCSTPQSLADAHYYTVFQKQLLCFLVITRQMNTNFHNSFTVIFRRKFSIDPLQRLPPYLSYVATLPCKIWKSSIFVFQRQSLPLFIICFSNGSLLQ